MIVRPLRVGTRCAKSWGAATLPGGAATSTWKPRPGVRRFSPTPTRQLGPLALAPALLGAMKVVFVKKLGFWGAYKALDAYGWPQAYRRLLKFNRANTLPELQPAVQTGLRTAIVTPGEAYNVFKQSHMYDFMSSVAKSGEKQLPAWIVSIAESLAGRTHVYKALKVMEAEHAKQLRKAAEKSAQRTTSLEAELRAAKLEIERLKEAQEQPHATKR